LLLHQQGALALHGSAIETPRGVVAFVGASGNGKSTLAMALHDRGHRLVADDICAVVLDDNRRPVAMPSYPRLKLWGEMVVHSGRKPQHLARIQPREEKYAVPIPCRFAVQANVLDTVYVLNVSDAAPLALQPCQGAAKLAALLDNTYRFDGLRASGMAEPHFRLAAEVARHVRVCRVTRPATPFLLEDLVDRVEGDFSREH